MHIWGLITHIQFFLSKRLIGIYPDLVNSIHFHFAANFPLQLESKEHFKSSFFQAKAKFQISIEYRQGFQDIFWLTRI